MLRISRSRPTPFFHDLVEKPRDQLLHWAHRDPAERRQRRAPIDHDLFHHGHLVDMVTSDFNHRCAYCERIASREGVAHFRPPAIVFERHESQFADHYSWLAYEWLNLALICNRCRRRREDRFPVMDRRARFLATLEDVRAEEKPLLLDPTVDTPSRHLSFLINGECFPNVNSSRAAATVSTFGLNDRDLVIERYQTIREALEVWRSVLESHHEFPEDFLVRGPFVGACRDVLRRTLSEYALADASINNGQAFVRRLSELLERSDSEQRERMWAAAELLEHSDKIRSAELARRAEHSSQSGGLAVAGRDVPTPSLPRVELKSLHLSNFRAVDDLTLSFREGRPERHGAPCLLLLGENAVGKSTCLAATALALLGTREVRRLSLRSAQLARSGERSSWSVWGKTPFEIEIGFQGAGRPASISYDPVRRQFDGTPEQSAVVLGYGPHRFFRKLGARGPSAASGVRSLFEPLHPIPDPEDWLMGLRGRPFEEVVRTIRTILPIGEDDDLVNDPRYGICVRAQGQVTAIAHLSEGYRSIFAMVADMCRSLLDHWDNLETANAVVMIDEIETHLHPRWKMRVMSSLRRAFPKVQFIATSHDPLCVRGMDDGEVVVLARAEDGSVHLLDDLPDVSGMRAEQLLTSEFFGLSSTIDPDVQIEIARFASRSAEDPEHAIGDEARELVSRLTIGDSATAQIIHKALLRYLREREGADQLSGAAREDAVGAVLAALRKSRAAR